MLDLRTLEIFYWVAQLGGFRRAADKLHTTQPAISNRIAQMEQRLGVQLIDRTRRRMVLTPAGLTLLGYAERILALQHEATDAVTDPAQLHGTVRLGTSETIVHTWLSVLIRRLHDQFPHIVIDISVDISSNLEAALLAGEIDVAFLLGPVAQPHVRDLRLNEYPIGWAACPGLVPARKLGLADLAAWPIITYARTTLPARQVLDLFSRAGLPRPRLFANSSVSSLVRMAVDGIGICAVATATIAAELGGGRLQLLDVEPLLSPLMFTASYIHNNNRLAEAVAMLAQQVALDQAD